MNHVGVRNRSMKAQVKASWPVCISFESVGHIGLISRKCIHILSRPHSKVLHCFINVFIPFENMWLTIWNDFSGNSYLGMHSKW